MVIILPMAVFFAALAIWTSKAAYVENASVCLSHSERRHYFGSRATNRTGCNAT